MSNSDDLVLSLKKRKALNDFIAICPVIVTKATVQGNIEHSFTESGMIDTHTRRFPHLGKIVGTCRRKVHISEYAKIIESFPYLYKIQCEQGWISDSIYEGLGFVKDKDCFGNVHRRDSTVSQEWRQRAKCLTHEVQSALRNVREEEANQVERKKDNDAKELRREFFATNRKAVECLYTKHLRLTYVPGDESKVSECSFEHFYSLNIPQLVAFLVVRNEKYSKKTGYGNKGKIEEARTNGNNLVNLAFSSRFMENAFEHEFCKKAGDSDELGGGGGEGGQTQSNLSSIEGGNTEHHYGTTIRDIELEKVAEGKK